MTRLRPTSSPNRHGRYLAAAISVTGVAMILIWAVAVPVGPEVCALTYPAPRNCFASDRLTSAIGWTIALGILATMAGVLSYVHPRRRGSAAAGLIILIITAAVSFLSAAWLPSLA